MPKNLGLYNDDLSTPRKQDVDACYGPNNAPPYPVTSVNGQTGGVNLTASDVGADASGTAAAVQSNLDGHTGNTTVHITASERTGWNGKSEKSVAFTVTLTAAGWSNNAQTVSHAMLKAAGYGYIYNPDEASYGAYVSALVRCGDVVMDGQVTFYCDETPTDDITVDFMRIEANENV